MSDESNTQLDETLTLWIDEHKENIQSMYEAYCLEIGESICTFEEFAVYMFYECGH